MPRNDSVGPSLVALGGVVVDHVEDHLDARLVQPAHHLLELVDAATGRDVAGGRGEEADGVVAPVVRQALFDQVAIVEEGLDRHQLDRRDPEPDQMVDRARVGQATELAAQPVGQVPMLCGNALDVRLVDHGVGPGAVGAQVRPPGHGRIDHHAFRHHECRIAPVEGEIAAAVADPVAEDRIVPADLAVEFQRVGVEQQLVGIEAVAVVRLVGTVDAIAVKLAGADLGQVAVPDLVGVFRKRHPGQLAPSAAVEEAELDPAGVGGEEREIRARSVPGRTERKRTALGEGVAV